MGLMPTANRPWPAATNRIAGWSFVHRCKGDLDGCEAPLVTGATEEEAKAKLTQYGFTVELVGVWYGRGCGRWFEARMPADRLPDWAQDRLEEQTDKAIVREEALERWARRRMA